MSKCYTSRVGCPFFFFLGVATDRNFLASFLEGEDGGRMISPNHAHNEFGLASVTCLLSGLHVFGQEFPNDKRSVRVLKGLHGFHVYSSEYWLDHLLAVGNSDGGFDSSSELCASMSRLSSRLSQLEAELPDLDFWDDQLGCLKGFGGLCRSARYSLKGEASQST